MRRILALGFILSLLPASSAADEAKANGAQHHIGERSRRLAEPVDGVVTAQRIEIDRDRAKPLGLHSGAVAYRHVTGLMS